MKQKHSTESTSTSPRIETWPIDRPKPYERNPRRNEVAVAKVAASIRDFGWDSAIVVDRDGVIIAGHTRLKAAQKLGLTEVPVIVRADLSEEKARALRLADNKAGEFSEWDSTLLDEELSALAAADVEMAQYGFELPTEEKRKIFDPKTIFDPQISILVECSDEADAEEKFRTITEELGWEAKISTL